MAFKHQGRFGLIGYIHRYQRHLAAVGKPERDSSDPVFEAFEVLISPLFSE